MAAVAATAAWMAVSVSLIIGVESTALVLQFRADGAFVAYFSLWEFAPRWLVPFALPITCPSSTAYVATDTYLFCGDTGVSAIRWFRPSDGAIGNISTQVDDSTRAWAVNSTSVLVVKLYLGAPAQLVVSFTGNGTATRLYNVSGSLVRASLRV
jgi:hypothetical protein